MFDKGEMWKGNCYDRRVKALKCRWHPPDAGELALLLSQEEYEHELTEILIKEDAFIDVMTKIHRVLTKIYNLETNISENSSVRETTSTHTHPLSNPAEAIKVKLPKSELKPFDKNILNRQPFWDRFQSSIDSNSSICPVDKFTYLQSF